MAEILAIREPLVAGKDSAARADIYRTGGQLCIATEGSE